MMVVVAVKDFFLAVYSVLCGLVLDDFKSIEPQRTQKKNVGIIHELPLHKN
jgi:hypothetical protein